MAITGLAMRKVGLSETVELVRELTRRGAHNPGSAKEAVFTGMSPVAVDIDGDSCPETVAASFDKGILEVSVNKIMQCNCRVFRKMEVKTGPENKSSHTVQYNLGEKATIESAGVFVLPQNHGTRIWVFTSEGVIEAKIDVKMEPSPEWYCKQPDGEAIKGILKNAGVN